MFTIDIHTHILPENIPNFKEKFGYGGFINLEHHKPCCAKMMKDGQFFREVEANCWDGATRATECDHYHVDVQVLSTVPVMFSYWAKPKDTLEVSKFLNDSPSGRIIEITSFSGDKIFEIFCKYNGAIVLLVIIANFLLEI